MKNISFHLRRKINQRGNDILFRVLGKDGMQYFTFPWMHTVVLAVLMC